MSFEKRSRRKFKLEALLRGADPLSGVSVADGSTMPTSPRGHAAPQYSDWDSAIARKSQTWYEAPDHGEQQPTDKDNWDIPEGEVHRLMLSNPGTVVIRKT